MNIKTLIFLIFILAFIPRLILAFYPMGELNYDDSGYDIRAMSILEDKVFGEDQKPNSFKPPFYSFFLAVIYFFFGHNYLAVRIIQSIISSLSCIIIYFIALRLTDRNIALVSGLLAALNFSFIKSSSILLSESLSTFLISLLVLVLVQLRQAPTISKRICVGLLSGLIALTRSEMVFFLPFVYLSWVCLLCLKRYSLSVFLKDMLVTLAIFFIVISIWTIRNWRIHHTFVPLTTAVGINFYSSFSPPEGKLFGLTANDDIVTLSRTINNEAEQSKFLFKETFKFIRVNIDKIPRLELLKFIFFWSVFDWEVLGRGTYNISYAFMLPLFILGLFVNIKKWHLYTLLYVPILYFQGTALLFYGSPRFRIPCEPFIIIFAAVGIMYLFQRFYRKIIPAATLTLSLLVNVAFYFYAPLLRNYLKCIFIKVNLW